MFYKTCFFDIKTFLYNIYEQVFIVFLQHLNNIYFKKNKLHLDLFNAIYLNLTTDIFNILASLQKMNFFLNIIVNFRDYGSIHNIYI